MKSVRWILAFAAAMLALFSGRSFASEPAQRFLERLREQGMHDWAAKYVDIYAKKSWLPEEMRSDAPLERLMILQDSLASVKTVAKRESTFDEIEKGFREFLEAYKESPRRGEARVRLGDVYMTRGQTELRKLDDPKESANADAHRTKGRELLVAANKTYGEAVSELKTEIEKLAGNRATTPEQIANRKTYQVQYRQGQIFDGYTAKLVAETYAMDSAEAKDWLVKSATKLDEVVSKAVLDTEFGAKTLARLHRGDVLAMQGLADKAIESYTSVADNEAPGIFRTWKVMATAAMVRVMISAAGKEQFDEALKRGLGLWKEAQNSEKFAPEWMDLQLAIAEVRVAAAAKLESQKGNETQVKGNRREAREMLTAIVRRSGQHQGKAKKLLADLGFEPGDPNQDKVPVVKTFEEAMKFGREKIQKSESSRSEVAVLNAQLESIPEDKKAGLQSEIEEMKSSIDRDLNQALELFQQAVKLFKANEDRDELLEARFLVSFILLRSERFWESAAVADFVSMTGGGTSTGEKAGNIALTAYSKLLETASPEAQPNIIEAMEGLAKHLLATWGDGDAAQTSVVLLLKQSLNTKNWGEAERYLRMLPSAADQTNAIKRDLGYMVYGEYLKAERKNKQEKIADDPLELELRNRAENLMREGWEALKPESVDQRSVESAAALTSLYLRTSRLAEAEAIFAKPELSPLKLVESNDARITSVAAKLEVLRLHLQLVVKETIMKGTALDSARVQSIVKQMQSTGENAKNGTEQLAVSLNIFAQELNTEIEKSSDPATQAKIASATIILLTQLTDVSADPAILFTSARLMRQISDSLKVKNNIAGAKDAAVASSNVFEKLIVSSEKDPKILTTLGFKRETLLLLQAQSYRRAGEYKKAREVLVTAIKLNPGQLAAQGECASILQEEGESTKNVALLRQAIRGYESDPKTNKNIVWGWGNISKNVEKSMNSKDELKRMFFDSRLNLATCSYLIAVNTVAAADKQKAYESTLKSIRDVVLLYPDFDGPETKKEFDELTKKTQAGMNVKVAGLQGLVSQN